MGAGAPLLLQEKQGDQIPLEQAAESFAHRYGIKPYHESGLAGGTVAKWERYCR